MKLDELKEQIEVLNEKAENLQRLSNEAAQLEAWIPTKQAKLEAGHAAAALSGDPLPEDPTIEKDRLRISEIRKAVRTAKLELVPLRNKLGGEVASRVRQVHEKERAENAELVKDAYAKYREAILALNKVAGSQATGEFILRSFQNFNGEVYQGKIPNLPAPMQQTIDILALTLRSAYFEAGMQSWVNGYGDAGIKELQDILELYEDQFSEQDALTPAEAKAQVVAQRELLAERV